ncbi:MAG: hypothetical protein NTY41_18755 [Proteobacteria bacterium]|nr:hypothetical protein [Pseudomonadota bacterium]
MESLLLSNNLVSHPVIILVATVAVCVFIAYLLSLGDGRHFGQ